jgi:hypothetical protein
MLKPSIKLNFLEIEALLSSPDGPTGQNGDQAATPAAEDSPPPCMVRNHKAIVVCTKTWLRA